MEERCQVKGCENPGEYVHMSHEDGDKAMCVECAANHLGIEGAEEENWGMTQMDFIDPLKPVIQVALIFIFGLLCSTFGMMWAITSAAEKLGM